MEPMKRFQNRGKFKEYQDQLAKSKPGEAQVWAEYKDFGKDGAKERTERLQKSLSEKLHWEMNPNGTIPQDKNGKSRMFVVKWDAKARREQILEYDGKKLSDGTNLEFGGLEFIRQMQLGNVFAYPVGEPKPVQIGYRFNNVAGHEKSEMAISDPLESRKLVELLDPPPVPRRPGFFKRMIHAVVKSAFKADFDRYDAERKAASDWPEKNRYLTEQTQERESKRGELGDDANRDYREQLRDMQKAELAPQLAAAKKRLAHLSTGQKHFEAVYEPVPKIFKTEQTKDVKEFEGRLTDDPDYEVLIREHRGEKQTGKSEKEPDLKEGFYSAEHFKKLSAFGEDQLKLEEIKVGGTGQTVTKRQFCSVAMFSAMDKKYALEAEKYMNSHDVTLSGVLVKHLGLTEDEAKDVIGFGACSMYTTDLFRDKPRDNNGTYIECSIDPARRDAVEAFNAYKNGNVKPLATLIAKGVNSEANLLSSVADLGVEQEGACAAAGGMLELLSGDPKLKKAAFEAGMKKENLLTVQGAHEMIQLHHKACEANVKLMDATVSGKELSRAEKEQCVRDIVRAQSVIQTKQLETQNTKCEKAEQLADFTAKNGVNAKSSNPEEQIKNLPEGKVYTESGFSATEGVKAVFGGRPGTLMLLTNETGRKNVDIVADQIIQEKGLLDMDTADIVKMLDYNKEEQTEIGMRAMEIRTEKKLDAQPLAEIRKEAGIEAPTKAAPEPKELVNNVKPDKVIQESEKTAVIL